MCWLDDGGVVSRLVQGDRLRGKSDSTELGETLDSIIKIRRRMQIYAFNEGALCPVDSRYIIHNWICDKLSWHGAPQCFCKTTLSQEHSRAANSL